MFVDTVHNSNPRFGLAFQQRLNLDFNTICSVVIANFYVLDRAKSYIALDPSFCFSSFFDLEAMYILGIKIGSLLLSVTEEHRRIVQLRLISNLRRSIVWITCSLLTISQVVPHIFAVGFPVAHHWLTILQEEVV